MLATPNGLVVVNPLSPPDARQNLTFFIVAVFRNNHRDRLASCFFGSIAEDTLCPFIPAYDNAIEILAYDCVSLDSTIDASQRIGVDFRAARARFAHAR